MSLIHSPECSSLLAPLLPGALIALQSKHLPTGEADHCGGVQQMERRSTHCTPLSAGTRQVLTSDICGKRLMAKGRARPKAARHTRLCTGRIIRGRDLRRDVLQRKGSVRPFHGPDPPAAPTTGAGSSSWVVPAEEKTFTHKDPESCTELLPLLGLHSHLNSYFPILNRTTSPFQTTSHVSQLHTG